MCDSNFLCLQTISDHVIRLDDKVRDIVSYTTYHTDVSVYLIIPIIVLLFILIVVLVCVLFVFLRKEKVRFVASKQLSEIPFDEENLVE